MNNLTKEQELLDQFAGIALQGLISKMPLLDITGEVGQKIDQENITEVKKGIAATAYEYAQWMLIARHNTKDWMDENKKAFEQDK